jgi:hypothetical protein
MKKQKYFPIAVSKMAVLLVKQKKEPGDIQGLVIDANGKQEINLLTLLTRPHGFIPLKNDLSDFIFDFKNKDWDKTFFGEKPLPAELFEIIDTEIKLPDALRGSSAPEELEKIGVSLKSDK